MSALKIVCGDTVVDAIIDPVWVRQAPGIRLRCNESDAQGIVSHDQSTTYQIEDRPLLDGADSMKTVRAIVISKDEAAAIIAALDANQSIPEPEPEFPDDGSIEMVRENVINQMSAACNAAIVGGVDVTLSDGQTYHFSLNLEDQLNLLSLQGMIANGAEAVPYHADGEECRFFSTDDFTAVTTAATNWKLYNESYFNSLRAYIQSMETMEELLAVEYGMEVPAEYQTVVLQQMLVIQVQGGS